jgi:diguanylate cyclase (GGDEF)-like protein
VVVQDVIRAGSARTAIRLRNWDKSADIWLFNIVLSVAAAVLFFTGVARLPQTWGAVHVPFIVLVAAFTGTESWRVYIHFRNNAQSYSLSEIPLVVGLFFVTPNELLLARLIAAAIGLGLVRRHPPIKLIFNLASFALEAELVTLLFHAVLPGKVLTTPVMWFAVLLIIAAGCVLSFALSAVVISLAEDTMQRRQWLQPAVITLIGGMVNASLGIEVVSAVSRDAAEMLLLLVPIATLSVAYTLYTREHEKRQRVQHLYESSDLLHRAASSDTAISDLLTQLCAVFRAETAQVTLLPAVTGADHADTITVRRGVASQEQRPVSIDLLEGIVPVLDESRPGLLATPPRPAAEREAWLQHHRLRDGMATPLHAGGVLLGVLIVGNRRSDVATFCAGDLTLLETFAAQASVALENARLDHHLRHQMLHDPLTGLANRTLFSDRLEHALTRLEQSDESLAIVFMDVDDFKTVNDSLGYAAGDELLREVAERIRTVLRPSDTAARFGGDDFAILLEKDAEAHDVIAIAEQLVEVIRPHYTAASREVAVRASIGVATATSPVSAEELLLRADVAMYRSKRRGKGTFEVYEPGMQEVATRRLEVRTDLEHAIERRELVVHYQPVVDVASGSPVGVEALARWNHPRWGLVLPEEFISIAEETGVIDDVGMYVLEEACQRCHEWQMMFPDQTGFSVSVNVSPIQLRAANFVAGVWRSLARTGLHPSRLVLEITESCMVEDPDLVIARLHELRGLGVRIAIDDFGTGYSSLAALQELPVDILKIDKTFVDHIAEDPRHTAFAQAIIRMGKTLGLSLVAEGVEDAEQAHRLQVLGCSLAQGYHYCGPEDAAAITRLLRRAKSGRPTFGGPKRVLNLLAG